MPRARNKRDRLHQVANWLREAFPAGRPVELRVEPITPPFKKIEVLGDCSRYPKKLLIRVESRLVWEHAIAVLLHEWAHAVSWPLAKVENNHPEHSDEWGLAYGRIYRAFYDDHGAETADSYPVRTKRTRRRR